MNRKRWLYLVIAVVCVIGLLVSGCGAPAEEGPAAPTNGEEEVVTGPKEYVSWEGPYSGELLRYEKGAWVEGMEAGEENLYFEWKYGSFGAKDPRSWGLQHRHEEIWKRSKGHWQIKVYYGGMLAGPFEEPYLIGAGAYEMGHCGLTYFPAETPYAGLPSMPFAVPDDPVKGGDWSQYCYEHPLCKENYRRWNLFAMYSARCRDQYVVHLRKGVPEITKVEDFEGLMMRAFGYWPPFAECHGMIPANYSVGDSYEILQKGIIDVNITTPRSIYSRKLWEVCDRIIYQGIGSSGNITGANLDQWNALPQYLKEIWWEIIPITRDFEDKEAADINATIVPDLETEGFTFYKLSEEEWVKFAGCAYGAYSEWIVNSEQLLTGKKVREYLADCLAERERLTGKPWAVGFDPYTFDQ
jgi:TRAP-type C4-dicarboxylate transport system substrate-binding protein